MQPGFNSLKEIKNQPEVWRECLRILEGQEISSLVGGQSPSASEWLFVGCGTSYYLAQAAADTVTLLGGIKARAVPASEILLFPDLVFPADRPAIFPILISRSGHTSEVLQVADFLNRQKIQFFALTCDGNELEGLSSHSLKLPVVEQSTVMTSSFTSMLIALQFIAASLTGQKKALEGLASLPDSLSKLLSEYAPKVEQFAQRGFESIAYLAQGPLYAIASESSLKVMESSSSYSQFFHTLEFRHGPKSIVSNKVIVAALLSESGYEEESKVILEMSELGAQTMVVANQLSATVRESATLAIELDSKAPEPVRSALYVVWGQLLGSYVGLRKGLDPDSPRNLSRVVTLAG
jgi:glutamine---fructose-6-phosphate transaminase (isomerizing)